MASLITYWCCDSAKQGRCHTAAPIIDVLTGIFLVTMGMLIATGVLSMGTGALCTFVAAGAFLLGVGLMAGGLWMCHAHCGKKGFWINL